MSEEGPEIPNEVQEVLASNMEFAIGNFMQALFAVRASSTNEVGVEALEENVGKFGGMQRLLGEGLINLRDTMQEEGISKITSKHILDILLSTIEEYLDILVEPIDQAWGTLVFEIDRIQAQKDSKPRTPKISRMNLDDGEYIIQEMSFNDDVES